jgi:NaMN:DMB phosphoribosyltransferase
MQNNPLDLKNKIVLDALKRKKSDDPLEIISNFGDPMMPVCAGMLSSASEKCHVILAGGTQMLAVLQLAKHIGYNTKNSAIGCTSYIVDDSQAKFLETLYQIDNIAVLSCDPCLHNSQHFGFRSYADGFVKEGAGAGGAIIASLLKTENNCSIEFSVFSKDAIIAPPAPAPSFTKPSA